MKDLLAESMASCNGGDRAAVEQARKKNNELSEANLDDGKYCEWLWDASTASRSVATSVVDAGREVRFHLEYSSGTAAARGTKPLSEGHHYWEILMQSAVYGTDMMIGLGTAAVQMDKYRNQFCSFLGIDEESWGLSYTGLLHHGGRSRPYTTKFSQGTVIGIHLDMWRGTLTFYKDKRNLGVAYTGLQGKSFYPMVCSTAARSSMKILNAVYFPSSLQFLCCETIRRIVPKQLDVTEVMAMPPGLRNFLHNNLNWLLEPYTTSVQRRLENLDKANSLIDRVRTVLDERLDDQSPSDSYDECCDGVTEFSLHCDAEDQPFFKALNLSPRWAPESNRKRTKDQNSTLKKSTTMTTTTTTTTTREKRSLSGKTIRPSSTRLSTPSSDTAAVDAKDGSPTRQIPEAKTEDGDDGWSLLEILGAASTGDDEETRNSGLGDPDFDRINIPLSTTGGETKTTVSRADSKSSEEEDALILADSFSSSNESDSPDTADL